jgi:hypothetical protein
VAVGSAFQKFFGQTLNGRQALGFLTIIEQERLGVEATCAEAGGESTAPARPHAGRAKHEQAPDVGLEPAELLARLSQNAATHPHRVAR